MYTAFFVRTRSIKLFISAFSCLILLQSGVPLNQGTTPVTVNKALFLNETTSGGFSVITYNIAGLPQLISSAVTERAGSIAEIGRKLNQYDITHIQEDFNYNQHLYNQGNQHPFRTRSKGGVPFGDGLSTLSKFPVTDIRRIKWNDCTGADCLTPKGFSYSRVEIAKEVFIDFYNVHANANNSRRAAAARCKNIQQLSTYIKKYSVGNAVFVMGDLNGHYSYSYDNINLLLEENNLSDTWLILKGNIQLPIPLSESPSDDILNIEENHETIDKILFRSGNRIRLLPSMYKLEKEFFKNKAGLPLSDHHPVSAEFIWTVDLEEDAGVHVTSQDSKSDLRSKLVGVREQ
ncbi:endonuclease/exonuclease/phosphatase family protein [Runella sp.]|uniref:endonuclease/exonuclease/phosphatase family protein n=1 Tax=Runella sp. TaxID=1960881 RepID=UPI003D0FC780